MLSNTDKAVNITALVFITYLIGYGYMNDTIYAAWLGVSGAIIAAFLASYWTTRLTNKKAQEKEEHRLDLIRINLHRILESTIMFELNHQIKELSRSNDMLKKNTLYEKDNFRDASLLNNNLFTSFKEDDIMNICLKRKIPFEFVYNIFYLLPILYSKTMYSTDKVLIEYLNKLSDSRDLDFILENDNTFINHPEVQNKIEKMIVIIDKHIVLFKEVKERIEGLISDLKNKNVESYR